MATETLSREQLIEELREIEGSYTYEITPEKQRRAREIIHILRQCKCRTCGKQYHADKSRADLQGFCSAKCLHQRAKQCGYRKNGSRSEYICLAARNAVGSVYVTK